MGTLQDFQKLVIANAKDAKGLKVGEKAPDFVLPNALGDSISLSESLKSGPVILKFYRGEWCPLCNLDLREVQQYMGQIKKFNATVMAISPQKPDDALSMTQKNELEFEVLSDSDQKVIQAYHLQFDPGEDYHQRRDLLLLNGDGSKTLPVPATFIIGQNRTIIAAHVEANYTERMSPEDIITFLERTI
ncbi:peroxiredoxin-like family protein [Flagellimonas sp. CMM7]|uniref:peroxiredoxin-like family protein n=1 Tax=Flagellimonas sp. CMM7 TaxID=2654676 RepID=UPI0013CF8B68|nr:peroxiredoxin-like family protein [Flagellimonas sp. CMM7]UII80340.1 AhpC/TSA family protein [Flagellimonas sp. CMM7]